METLPGEETLIASWQALAQLSAGARLTRTGRHVAAVFPAWAPLNNAILSGPAATDAAHAAEELAALYRAAGVSTWAMWLRSPHVRLDTPGALSKVDGMTRDTTTLVMTRELSPGSSLHPAVVRTSIHTASLATDEPVSVIAAPDCVPNLDGWVYVHEGAAVAGAWSYLNGTDCGLYAIGTVPDFRRRGMAATLIQHVLAHAYRRGARTASLQSTRMGESLYRYLRFTAVGRYEEWVPAASASGSHEGEVRLASCRSA